MIKNYFSEDIKNNNELHIKKHSFVQTNSFTIQLEVSNIKPQSYNSNQIDVNRKSSNTIQLEKTNKEQIKNYPTINEIIYNNLKGKNFYINL